MGTWRGPDDAAAARLRAEHGMTGEAGTDGFSISIGSGALLPPWPPEGHDLIPCPTCWIPADLIAPTAVDVLHHSVCAAGHDNTLVPAVLEYLRRL